MTEFEEELITNWHRMNLQYQSLVIPPHLLKLAGEEAVVVELPVSRQRLAPVKEEGPCLQCIGTTSKNLLSSYVLPPVKAKLMYKYHEYLDMLM